MKYKLQLNYSEKLIRQAIFRFWLRTVGVGFLVVITSLIGAFAFMLYTNQSGWRVDALGAFLLVGVAFVSIIYLVHYKRSIEKFKSINPKSASFEVSEMEFSLSTSLGTVTLKWPAISEVWVYENMWLILFSKAQFSTIPLADVSEEAKVYILAQIKSSGGKIG